MGRKRRKSRTKNQQTHMTMWMKAVTMRRMMPLQTMRGPKEKSSESTMKAGEKEWKEEEEGTNRDLSILRRKGKEMKNKTWKEKGREEKRRNDMTQMKKRDKENGHKRTELYK